MKRFVVVAAGMLFALGVHAGGKAKKVEYSKYGKVLAPAKLAGGTNIQTGDAPGLTVEMVQVKGTEDYVVRFTGIDHENDGKTLKYTREPAGANAFYYSRDGRNLMREEKPMYSDVVVYTLYANQKEYPLVVDAEKTKTLKVDTLTKNVK